MKSGAAIGLDIGGGSTKIGLVDARGVLLGKRHVVLPEGACYDAVLTSYRDAIASLGDGAGALPCGVAYPGHVDRKAGIGLNSNVRLLDGRPLGRDLAGGASALVNDADAAAIAEAREHPEGASGRILMVTLGTGIGVSMIISGRPLETAGGTLGDSGHLNVDPAGQHRCRQGCAGCLESVASGVALERDATALGRAGRGLALAAEYQRAGMVSAAAACRAALSGDAEAMALTSTMAQWMGMAVASWRAIFQPDLIVFGGGLSALGQDFIDMIAAKALPRTLPFLVANSRLTIARLGNDAGMIGAALAALAPRTEE